MKRFIAPFFSLALINVFLFFSPLHTNEATPLQIENIQEAAEESQQLTDKEEFEFEDETAQELSYWKEFTRMMMILGAILGIVLLIAWLLRNFLNSRIKLVNENNVIKVLERRNLSQKSMMYLIEVYGKQFLVGDSAAGGVKFMMECHPTPEANPSDINPTLKPSKFSFKEILQKKLIEKQFKPEKNTK